MKALISKFAKLLSILNFSVDKDEDIKPTWCVDKDEDIKPTQTKIIQVYI